MDRGSSGPGALPEVKAVLGWAAAVGWWPTLVLIIVSPGWYVALTRGSGLPLAVLVLWIAAVVARVVWRAVTDRRNRSSRSGQDVSVGRRQARILGAVVVTVAVAWSAQQALTAGAAAVGAGSRSTFVGRTLSQSGRSTEYVYGTWGPNNRRAYLMDEQPLIGERVSISTPPLGGWEVYSGGVASSLLLVLYFAILVFCSWGTRRLLKPRPRPRGRRRGRA